MNFLAHLFLSGDNEDVMTGNFMADHIKGREAFLYKPDITKGIYLHRFIDHYTDHHEVVKESKKRLYANFHKYAPVISDIFYDHFLAAGFHEYSEIKLADYSQYCYSILSKNINIMPQRMQNLLPYMIRHDWLTNYARTEGAGRALSGLATRAKFVSNMQNALYELEENYDLYKKEFDEFFPDLQKNAAAFLEEYKELNNEAGG